MITEADVKTLSKTFLTKEDFKKISKTFVTKTEFQQEIRGLRGDIAEIRTDMSDMKEMIQGLIISVDGFTKSTSEVKVEQAAMGMQLTRHEKWHHKTAGKLKMKLEY